MPKFNKNPDQLRFDLDAPKASTAVQVTRTGTIEQFTWPTEESVQLFCPGCWAASTAYTATVGSACGACGTPLTLLSERFQERH